MSLFDENGFAIVPSVAGFRTDSVKLEAIHRNFEDDSRKGPGVRNLLTASGLIRCLANDMARSLSVRGVLGDAAFPVRAILFDKTLDANWNVPWHQDLSIAVKERRDGPGFSGWSLKQGVWHVQPPVAILESMVTVRLHLDDCGPGNGPLRVIPGSHRKGRLHRERIEWWKRNGEVVDCCLPAGGLMIMRPLLLHTSSPALHPMHRRVLHVEFASVPLPGGLEWAFASVDWAPALL